MPSAECLSCLNFSFRVSLRLSCETSIPEPCAKAFILSKQLPNLTVIALRTEKNWEFWRYCPKYLRALVTLNNCFPIFQREIKIWCRFITIFECLGSDRSFGAHVVLGFLNLTMLNCSRNPFNAYSFYNVWLTIITGRKLIQVLRKFRGCRGSRWSRSSDLW